VGLSSWRQWRHCKLWRWLMAAATVASLPPPPTTTTAILALIALALTLPWTRIGWQGGGRAMMHLIHPCHGCRCWRHLCLHLRNNGSTDGGRSNRRGRTANIHGQERWYTTTPLAWSMAAAAAVWRHCRISSGSRAAGAVLRHPQPWWRQRHRQ
jgi:hypothetical protein